MKNNSTYYIDLITSYFSNESTQSDAEILAEWLSRDPENLKIFKEYQKAWEIIEKTRIEQLNVDTAWQKLEGKILEIEEIPIVQQQSVPSFGQRGKNFRYQFIDRTFPVRYQRLLRMAAVILIIAIPTFLVFRHLIKPEQNKLNAVAGILESKLADGTSVTLNSGSILEYPSRFTGSQRNVILAGEAWFEVAHDKTKPFIISNGKVRIEVLGTSFYVNTKNSTGNMEVILSSGKVAIYYDDQPSVQVQLEPGEKAEIMNEKEKISKSSNDDDNFLSWKTKIFVFNDDPMGKIIQALNKVYHSNIKFSKSEISNCRITATFDNQSLESILNVLKSTVNLTIIKNGSEIEISGDGCR
jgi:transmembrane sensor